MAAKFMEVATDDVLTEILLRLPDARSVIRSSLVCKRWHSLLLLQDNGDYFKNRFVEFHQNTPKLSELLFNVSELAEGDFHRIPLTLPSESEAILCDLSFVPPSEGDRVILLATCDDLVLVSPRGDQIFVYNLLTKQCLALPKVPEETLILWNYPSSFGYAIAFNQGSYKVVIVCLAYFDPRGCYFFYTIIFHPEMSEWRVSRFSLPFVDPPRVTRLSSRLQIVVVGGVLYWLDSIQEAYGLASVDPFGVVDGFENERRFIPLPDRFREIDVPSRRHVRGFKDKFRLGAVCGRLRMSQLMKNSEDDSRRFELLIWELNSDDGSSWALVHEAALEIHATESLFFVLGFHPSDKNVIFLVRGREVFRYNIVRDKYEKVSRFPTPNGCELNVENVAQYLNVLTVVHPTWPTPPTSVLQAYQDEIIP